VDNNLQLRLESTGQLAVVLLLLSLPDLLQAWA
jgi:hypothetical protein